MLTISTPSILNVDFNIKKGMILSWKFNAELSKDRFFKHLILIDH